MNTEGKKKQLNSAIYGILEDFRGSVERQEDDFTTLYNNLLAEFLNLLDVIYDADPSLPALEDIDTRGDQHQGIGGGSSGIVRSSAHQKI
ncbi:MAG TPA: hypothetical protein ENO27_02805 [Caldithrix sp.]|nr:hypothetical protein [Caldithrix sp.]